MLYLIPARSNKSLELLLISYFAHNFDADLGVHIDYNYDLIRKSNAANFGIWWS